MDPMPDMLEMMTPAETIYVLSAGDRSLMAVDAKSQAEAEALLLDLERLAQFYLPGSDGKVSLCDSQQVVVRLAHRTSPDALGWFQYRMEVELDSDEDAPTPFFVVLDPRYDIFWREPSPKGWLYQGDDSLVQ